MNKSELIEVLYNRHSQYAYDDVASIVSVILGAISQQLAQGGRIELRGFGAFTLVYRPPRKSRNPKSGESVDVLAKYVPHFNAGKLLREQVDYKNASLNDGD